MPKIKKSAKLSKTSAIQARAMEAEELEKKKLGIKREMEKIMAEYAKITGFSKLRARKYRVGDAPNDWRREDHRLDSKK
ncbi:MAG: hypothetical protein IJW03_04600 [Clostridia bacterium]|nr:hypothetical protein [Clostridia bacterium]